MKEVIVSGDSIEFGDLDEMVGITLIRAYGAAYKYFYQSIDADMKPGFYTSLSLILQNPGLTQKSLARAIRRDPSSVVPMLDALEKKGWVMRQRSETDRRAHELYLTPAGRVATKKFDGKVRRLEAEIETRFGKKNSRQLKVLLRELEAFFLKE